MEKLIAKNLITAIPGIGLKYAQRLNAAGIKKVSATPERALDNYFC